MYRNDQQHHVFFDNQSSRLRVGLHYEETVEDIFVRLLLNNQMFIQDDLKHAFEAFVKHLLFRS